MAETHIWALPPFFCNDHHFNGDHDHDHGDDNDTDDNCDDEYDDTDRDTCGQFNVSPHYFYGLTVTFHGRVQIS